MARYRVCGSRAVLGHRPGDEFTAHLDETQERRLIAGGHIRPAASRKPTPDAESAGKRQRDEE